MIRIPTAAFLVIAAASVATGCSRGEAAVPAVATGPATAAASSHGPQAADPLPRLVFFMNPNGMPCQMQDRILKDMGAELTGRASVTYYRTTEPADIAKFQEYGIRSLPMLVVTDAAGRELRRATPGIRSMPEVLQLLQP